MPKYKDYSELSEAFKKGELGRGYYVMVDKGGSICSLEFYDDLLSLEDNEEKQDGCSELFNPDDDTEPVEQMLTALGIPFNWS